MRPKHPIKASIRTFGHYTPSMQALTNRIKKVYSKRINGEWLHIGGNNMKIIKKLLFLVLIALSSLFYAFITSTQSHTLTPAQNTAIVFDLGGVLFDTDRSIVLNEQIGKYYTIRYALLHISFSSKTMKTRWFAVLEQVAKNNNHTYAFHNEDGTPLEVKDEHGSTIPSYMLEWMTGKRSNKELFDEIVFGIQALKDLSYSDKQFMINLTKVFLPELFVASRKPIQQTVALLKSLKKKGYPLYVLSNWDKESFEKMLETYPEIFKLFDGYIVSGIVHLAKPDPRIYKELERQFPHAEYIFIDDQKDNLATARECGWNALKVKYGALQKKKTKQAIMALL